MKKAGRWRGAGRFAKLLKVTDGQVAQLVERGPEKAGVGGSSPSLATIRITHLPKDHALLDQLRIRACSGVPEGRATGAPQALHPGREIVEELVVGGKNDQRQHG